MVGLTARVSGGMQDSDTYAYACLESLKTNSFYLLGLVISTQQEELAPGIRH
jgi:hypothetical protein